MRLGWHDAGTYDRNIKEWPQRGGANGSLRFDVELKHGANAGTVFNISQYPPFVPYECAVNNLSSVGILKGLINALKLVQPIKDKYPNITYADLFQLASATAIEV